MTARTQEKTWRALEAEIVETFRKWDGYNSPIIISPYSSLRAASIPRTAASVQRRAFRPAETDDERAVGLEFRDGLGQRFQITTKKCPRPIDNLRRLATAVEMLRMAEVRDVSALITLLDRQLHPEPAKQASPKQEQPKAGPSSSGPYAVLHVANNAPLEVAEAAYRALVKAAHPDVGGAHTQMVALNAAIAKIRAEKEPSQ